MNREFMEAMYELSHERGIAKEVLFDAINTAVLSAYRKHANAPAQNIRVEIDEKSGEINVYAQKTVVVEVSDPHLQISLEEARAINPNYQEGDVVEIEVTPQDFGRIAAQTAKQVVIQRIREAERDLIYEEFVNRQNDIVTGVVQRHEQRNVYVDLGKVEAVLPPSEQMPNENYRYGDRIKAYITEVRKTTKGPQVLLSRTHPGLLKRLFELEVPEIYEGVVEIKAVAREPGHRSKVAVWSRDENVDPVGACVGQKGIRVQTIVRELRGEKIDVIPWSSDIKEFIAHALSPAKVVAVYPNEAAKTARVVVPDQQLSLAIGREGQNARLAARLTGWKIDIKSETQMEQILAMEALMGPPLPPEEVEKPVPEGQAEPVEAPPEEQPVPAAAQAAATPPIEVDSELFDRLLAELIKGGETKAGEGKAAQAPQPEKTPSAAPGKDKEKKGASKRRKSETLVLKDLRELEKLKEALPAVEEEESPMEGEE